MKNIENGYIELAAAILERAEADYKTLLKGGTITGTPQASVEGLEKFFRSRWGQLLSQGNGELIIERIRAEAEAELKEERKKKREKKK